MENTPLLASEAFHYLEGPSCIDARVSDLLALRESKGLVKRPLIVWEPSPLACIAGNLHACLASAQNVDVFSPNHLELTALFGKSPSSALDKAEIESLARRFLDGGVGPDGRGIVLIRAGQYGCLVSARHIPFTWLPPFYKPDPAGKPDPRVVDATGAGNAFLGAYAAGYLKTGDAITAACYGSVGASFALEQVGMPQRSGDGSEELWNGEAVLSRLREYQLEREPVTSSQLDWKWIFTALGGWLTSARPRASS